MFLRGMSGSCAVAGPMFCYPHVQLSNCHSESFFVKLHLDPLVFIISGLLLFSSPDDLDFLQSISTGFSVEKDPELAAKCRERGNSSFKTRDYTAAALHYSQVGIPVGIILFHYCCFYPLPLSPNIYLI